MTSVNLSTSILPSCTYKEDFKRYLLPSIYSLVFIFGLPLNFIIILRIRSSRHALTCSKIYMLNLAVADFLYVCSLPLLIYNYASWDYWPFGDFTCRMIRFQFYSNLHGSIFFLTCISFQRYLGICHPLTPWPKQGGRKLAWIICAGIWVAVLVLCAPTFDFAATGIQRNRTVCYDLSIPDRALEYFPYGIALTCLGFILPFLVIVVLYCKMARVLCQTGEARGDTSAEKKRKAVKMIIIVMLVFAISFLPFHVTKTLYLLVRTLPTAPCELRNILSVAYKSMRPFASMNSVLDPILFYFTQPQNRRTTKGLLLKITSFKDKGAKV